MKPFLNIYYNKSSFKHIILIIFTILINIKIRFTILLISYLIFNLFTTFVVISLKLITF